MRPWAPRRRRGSSRSSSISRTARTPTLSRTRRRTRPNAPPSRRKSSASSRSCKKNSGLTDDRKWMAEALALGEAARGQSAPNPNVGCVIVSPQGERIGRGATASGGRPHAEAIALEQAGKQAKGATVYVTLEPCAHESPRGPACTQLLLQAKPARVVIALKDPDSRTSGQGLPRLRAGGIDVTLGVGREAA